MHGHFATVDVTATLMVALALLCCARAITGGALRDVALAGFCSGLAGAAKYNCVLIVVAALAAVLMRESVWRTRLRDGAIVALASIGGFLVGCPGVLMNWAKFRADLSFEAWKSGQGMGALFAGTGNGYLYHVTTSLRYGLAMPLLLLTLAAVVHAIVRRERGTVLLMAFIVPYYLLIGYAQVRFMRYVIPMLPALMLLVGRTLTLQLPYRTRMSRALSGVGVLVFLMTLLISVALDRQMAGPDARDEARDFIAAHVPAGKTIAFAVLPSYAMPLLVPAIGHPGPASARRRAILESAAPWTFRLPAEGTEWDAGVLIPPPDYVLLSDFETEDMDRLHDSRAMPWLATVRGQYSARAFENVPSVLGLSLGKPAWLPNDWLYICPRITLYTRR